MNNKQCTPEFLLTFHCVEDPEYSCKANKELYGDYDEYIKSVLEKYNSDDSDEY